MMENRPPLTSPDGSRNRNTPERCPHPLYSRDSTQEHQEIPQTRPLYSRDSTQEHQEIPQTRLLYSRDSTQEHHEIPQARPLYSQDSTQEHQEIPQEDQDDQGEDPMTIKVEVKEEAEQPSLRDDEFCKEEERSPEISSDGSRNRNTPERCPRPLYSRDSTQDHQNENLIYINVKVKEEETQGSSPLPCKEENIPEEIGTDGRYRSMLHEKKEVFPRFESGEWLIERPKKKTDAVKNTCLECGKTFAHRSSYSHHKKIHTGLKPFSCSECGKCFILNSALIRHQMIHTGEKPFFCSECGKCFNQKTSLIAHQRTHTGEKPFACSDCGECFAKRLSLAKHQRVHTGERC